MTEKTVKTSAKPAAAHPIAVATNSKNSPARFTTGRAFLSPSQGSKNMPVLAEIVRTAVNPAEPPVRQPAAAKLFDGLTPRERQEYFGRWAYDGRANVLIGRDDYLGKIVLWDGKTLKRRSGDGYTILRSVN